MFMKKNLLINFIQATGVLMLFLIAHSAFAAKIIVHIPKTIQPEVSFPVDILLDPEGASVNTFSAQLTIPNGMDLNGTVDRDSIITLWIKKPGSTGGGQTREISGIITGGFSGLIDPFAPKKLHPGNIIRLMMVRHGTTTSMVGLDQIHLYQDDGLATEIPVTIETVAVTPESENVVDYELPEPFIPQLIRESLIDDARMTLVFDTKDKLSGMDHFEIKEGESSWQIAQSPYVFDHARIKYPLLVKAVDRSGNARVVTVVPVIDETAEPRGIAYLAIIGIVLAVLLIMYMRKSKR